MDSVTSFQRFVQIGKHRGLCPYRLYSSLFNFVVPATPAAPHGRRLALPGRHIALLLDTRQCRVYRAWSRFASRALFDGGRDFRAVGFIPEADYRQQAYWTSSRRSPFRSLEQQIIHFNAWRDPIRLLWTAWTIAVENTNAIPLYNAGLAIIGHRIIAVEIFAARLFQAA